MNDYQMSYIAEARRRDMLAEADRARLARAAQRNVIAPKSTRPRSTPRLNLGALLGRTA